MTTSAAGEAAVTAEQQQEEEERVEEYKRDREYVRTDPSPPLLQKLLLLPAIH